MKEPFVVLKKNKDKAVRNHHHWIFSGAVRTLPDFEDGDILGVQSAGGDFLGYAYFNRRSSIIGRMLTFERTPPPQAIDAHVDRALALRKKFVEPETNAYRLINAEGDGLPGLIVDRYDDVLVVQVATLGMEKLKPLIVSLLVGKLAPRTIYEKSILPARREDGIPDSEGLLYGAQADTVEIRENGLRFMVEITGSQKTGFYLDLRPMRRVVRSLARGRRVLNCFCYTGAFSAAALAGGAASVDSVDSSERAVSLARRNAALNGFHPEEQSFFVADAFDFLRRDLQPYDFVILDPPSFAKRKTEVVRACRGYKDINRLALQKIRPGGLLLTFSCSHFVDGALFQQVIFQAAGEAGRGVRILQRHHLAYDHPINLYHPESEYLKSLLLYVD
jgi:23S rRNA (cytosine1962-C5)-methyltransferase